MIDRCCPTLSRGLLKREFVNTAAAFGVLVLLGFAVSMLRPALAQGVLERFTAQLEQLGLTDDVPQAELLATLFFNNVTAALLSMLYGLIPFVPLSALAIGTNALLLGAFAALYLMQGYGLGVYLVGILPHGVFELTALILACTLGLLICRTGTDRLRRKKEAVPLWPRLQDCLRVFLFADRNRIIYLLVKLGKNFIHHKKISVYKFIVSRRSEFVFRQYFRIFGFFD